MKESARSQLRTYVLFALIARCAAALSPELTIGQYHHTSWTEGSGRALPEIRSLVQSGDGYLVMATTTGYMRFDGVRLSDWDPRRDAPLAGGVAHRLLSARDGALWLANDTSIWSVRPGNVRQYALPQERRYVEALLEDRTGNVWIAVEDPAAPVVRALMPSGQARSFGPGDGLPDRPVRSIVADGDAFWLGIDDGICGWKPGQPARCIAVAGRIESLSLAAPGDLIAASVNSVYRMVNGTLETVAPTLGHVSILRQRLLVDRDRNVWIGTTGGLMRLSRGRIESFTRKEGLSGDGVFAIVEDAEGDIWIGTNAGIDRFRNPRVLHLSSVNGLSGDLVTVVEATADGSTWIGTTGAGLNRVLRGAVTRYSQENGVPGRTVTSLYPDSSGRLWVAGSSGLAYFANGAFTAVRSPGQVAPVFALSGDGSGNLWAVGGRNVWVVRDTTAKPFGGTLPADVFRVAGRSGGGLVFGSYGSGLIALDHHDTAGSELLRAAGGPPRAILSGRDGCVWVGAGNTLTRIRNGRQTRWGPEQGLPEGEIQGMVEDGSGDFWIVSTDAVARISGNILKQLPDGNPGQPKFIRYGASDGLRLALRPGMVSPRIAAAPDGRVWVCERDGVAILDPALLEPNKVPPPVVVEQLSVDGSPLYEAAPAFRGRQLQITYTGNSLMAPERVRFRYRLEPVDAGWTDAGDRRQVTFVNLPPGSYRFRVTACNLDSVCNESGAAVQFRVVPYAYQTLWFRAFVAVAIGAAIWGVYKLRLRQVRARYELVAQERARITREIHDSLLQGFTGVVFQLDGASRQFETDPVKSKQKLDQALDQADRSLREARQLLLDMRLPILENQTLAEALDEVGKKAVEGTPIAFQLRTRGTEGSLAYPAMAALFLIGREAINNAVSHANPGRILVQVVFTGNDCRLTVQDDGAGFDLETARRKAGHLGVQSMAERARQVGATFQIETAPSSGTKVEVVAPCRKRPPAEPV
jgi:signal transduction histidine kinase/ligand-binding sensor domain-containing protein